MLCHLHSHDDHQETVEEKKQREEDEAKAEEERKKKALEEKKVRDAERAREEFKRSRERDERRARLERLAAESGPSPAEKKLRAAKLAQAAFMTRLSQNSSSSRVETAAVVQGVFRGVLTRVHAIVEKKKKDNVEKPGQSTPGARPPTTTLHTPKPVVDPAASAVGTQCDNKHSQEGGSSTCTLGNVIELLSPEHTESDSARPPKKLKDTGRFKCSSQREWVKAQRAHSVETTKITRKATNGDPASSIDVERMKTLCTCDGNGEVQCCAFAMSVGGKDLCRRRLHQLHLSEGVFHVNHVDMSRVTAVVSDVPDSAMMSELKLKAKLWASGEVKTRELVRPKKDTWSFHEEVNCMKSKRAKKPPKRCAPTPANKRSRKRKTVNADEVGLGEFQLNCFPDIEGDMTNDQGAGDFNDQASDDSRELEKELEALLKKREDAKKATEARRREREKKAKDKRKKKTRLQRCEKRSDGSRLKWRNARR